MCPVNYNITWKIFFIVVERAGNVRGTLNGMYWVTLLECVDFLLLFVRVVTLFLVQLCPFAAKAARGYEHGRGIQKLLSSISILFCLCPKSLRVDRPRS